MRIEAAVLRAIGTPGPYAQTRPLCVEVLELGIPGPGEALVKVLAAGLCHSDLSVINGDRPRPVPMALGHEACVEVLESDDPDFPAGTRAVLTFVPSCGQCGPCRDERPALCEPAVVANTAGTLLSGERRLTADDGGEVHHHLGCSAFATHAVVSTQSLVAVPDDLPPEVAALFGCAVLTGVGAVTNTAQVTAGQSVAVIGLGGVGLAAVMGAIQLGASPVIAIDLSPDKLAQAAELGAVPVAVSDTTVDEVRALDGDGVDVAIECAGAVAAFDTAYKVTKRGGTTVSAGLANPAARWELSPVQLVAEERTIKGSYLGGAVPRRDIPRYIELYRSGVLPVDTLLDRTLPLSEINEAMDELAAGRAVRQVVTP